MNPQQESYETLHWERNITNSSYNLLCKPIPQWLEWRVPLRIAFNRNGFDKRLNLFPL
jgi:hypothetical protein